MIRRIAKWVRIVVLSMICLGSLVLGWPLANEYLQNRSRLEQLQSLQSSHRDLKQREKEIAFQHAELESQLVALDTRATTGSSVTERRDQVLALVRQRDCRIRQVVLEDTELRGWKGPTDTVSRRVESEDSGEESYRLNSTTMKLVITGQYSNVHRLVSDLVDARYLAIVQFLTIQPIDSTATTVQLDLRMSFFGLDTPDNTEDALETDLVAQSS